MAYSIENRYSILNNYHYNNKPLILSCIDVLSTPCRRVLGGRQVHVINQTYQLPGSLAARVTILFLSLIIFPIALVSVASFGIKLLSLPWFWQKKQIQIQSLQAQASLQKIEEDRQRFLSLINEGKRQQAIEAYIQNPKIGKGNTEAYHQFVWAIDWKITPPHSWFGLPQALSLLKFPDLIDRLSKAIQARLNHELACGHKTTGREIRELISASLKGYCREEQANFVQKVLDNILTSDRSDNLFLRGIKMDLADELILFFKELKYGQADSSDALSQLRIAAQQHHENIQRRAVCHSSDTVIFLTPESVKTLRRAVSSLHTIQLYVESLIQEATFAQGTSIDAKKTPLADHLRKFSDSLAKKLEPFSTDSKQQYIEHAQTAIQMIINLLECSPSNSILLARLADSCANSLTTLSVHLQAFKPSLSEDPSLNRMLDIIYLHAASQVLTCLARVKSQILDQQRFEGQTTPTSDKVDKAS